MNPEISNYLKSVEPDFGQGFALFCKYSRNEAAMSWIGRKHDMPKLLYELKKLENETPRLNPLYEANRIRFGASVKAAPAPAPAKEAETIPEVRIRTYDDRRTKRSDLPPELLPVYDRNATDHKLMRGLHEKMKMAMTDKDRAILREKIMEVEARLEDGYSQIDGYFKQKAEADAAKDPFNESTCRSYISKALKRKDNSPKQIATCKARVKALQDHNCVLDAKTLSELKKKKLI